MSRGQEALGSDTDLLSGSSEPKWVEQRRTGLTRGLLGPVGGGMGCGETGASVICSSPAAGQLGRPLPSPGLLWGHGGGGLCYEIWAWLLTDRRLRPSRAGEGCGPAAQVMHGPPRLPSSPSWWSHVGRGPLRKLAMGQWVSLCPGWQAPGHSHSPVPAGTTSGPGPAPVHQTQSSRSTGLCPRWCQPPSAWPWPAGCPTLKPLSRNWQFCHIYSQQIGLSGARWGSLEARHEIGLKWRVRFFSPC